MELYLLARGVTLVYIPVVWDLIIPLGCSCFSDFSKNKILTRDNLGKRRNLEFYSCLFCSQSESITHLFFDCSVARRVWEVVSEVVGFRVDINYEPIAKLWLCNKKFGITNIDNLTVLVFVETKESRMLPV
jgi:hypothetical protein